MQGCNKKIIHCDMNFFNINVNPKEELEDTD